MNVSIVICVYNNLGLTRACLDSVEKHVRAEGVEVVVADDASTDDTPQVIPTAYPWVRYLRSDTNRGYGGTCTAAGLEASGDLLLLLNNDTEAQDDFLTPLLRRLASKPRIGMVGSRLLYPDGTLQHAGMAFNNDRIPYHVYRNFPATFPPALKARAMQVVTGACVVVPRKLFAEVGGFAAEYRNGFEDVDQCLRLGRQGYEIWYEPDACVVHHEGKSPTRSTHEDRNRSRFLELWQGSVTVDEARLYAEDHFPTPLQPYLSRFVSQDVAARWLPLVWEAEAAVAGVREYAEEMGRHYGLAVAARAPRSPGVVASVGGGWQALETRIAVGSDPPTGCHGTWTWDDLRQTGADRGLTLTQSVCFQTLSFLTPDLFLRRGRDLLARGVDMAPYVEQFRAMFPTAYETEVLEGDWRWTRGERAESLACYERAATVTAPRYMALRMAQALQEQGRAPEARLRLAPVLQERPLDVKARWLQWRSRGG